jgi:hypothetical protein
MDFKKQQKYHIGFLEITQKEEMCHEIPVPVLYNSIRCPKIYALQLLSYTVPVPVHHGSSQSSTILQ